MNLVDFFFQFNESRAHALIIVFELNVIELNWVDIVSYNLYRYENENNPLTFKCRVLMRAWVEKEHGVSNKTEKNQWKFTTIFGEEGKQ